MISQCVVLLVVFFMMIWLNWKEAKYKMPIYRTCRLSIQFTDFLIRNNSGPAHKVAMVQQQQQASISYFHSPQHDLQKFRIRLNRCYFYPFNWMAHMREEDAQVSIFCNSFSPTWPSLSKMKRMIRLHFKCDLLHHTISKNVIRKLMSPITGSSLVYRLFSSDDMRDQHILLSRPDFQWN